MLQVACLTLNKTVSTLEEKHHETVQVTLRISLWVNSNYPFPILAPKAI